MNNSQVDTDSQNYCCESDDDSAYSDAMSIGEFFKGECYGFDDFNFDDDNETSVRNLDDFKTCKRLVQERVINSRVQSGNAIFHSSESDSRESLLIDSDRDVAALPNNNDDTADLSQGNQSKFKNLLGFVVGASITINHDNDDEMNMMNNDTVVSDSGENGDDNSSESDTFLQAVDWTRFDLSPDFNKSSIPTFKRIAKLVEEESNVVLDSIQYVAYEIICSSFLLSMIIQGWDGTNRSSFDFAANDEELGDPDTEKTKNEVILNLKNMGAKEQLLMFVTGPAGAGKSTAITVAQRFCYEFCRSVGITWSDNTFLFTAMTGCAAALFGGSTIHSAAYLNSKKKNITDTMIRDWRNVKILIVDEVSMGTNDLMDKLNDYLNHFRRTFDCINNVIKPNMIFGGFSIIFSGDFRQIPPVGADDDQLLYKNPGIWENSINVAIMLKNSHRFKNDPIYGDILMRMWNGSFTEEDFDLINSRLLGNNVKVPSVHQGSDVAYACAFNSERSSIHASVFQNHIKDFPSVESDEPPPNNTVIIEADIREPPKHKPRKNSGGDDNAENIPHMRVDPYVRNQIYSTLSDYQLKDQQRKLIDPALKLYVGAQCMINDNDDIKKGRANGTLCRVVSVKQASTSTLHIRNYDGKKVYAINANDVEFVEFEHFPKSKKQVSLENEISTLRMNIQAGDESCSDECRLKMAELRIEENKRRFRLKPKTFYCKFNLEDIKKGTKLPARLKTQLKVTVRQLPINLNDATTGHKLQGMSKDQIIVQSWQYGTPGWPYTVLSRTRTLDNGLFLNERLDYKKFMKSFERNNRALKAFDERMKMKIPDKVR